MKTTLQNLKLTIGKVDSNQIRLMWFLLTLLLLVVGAGAPEGSTGWAGG